MCIRDSLATLYYRPAELEKAMDYYQNGLEISRKQGFQSRIGDILMGMGEVLVRQGKEQEAESSFKDALSIFEETEEEKGVISGLAHHFHMRAKPLVEARRAAA